MQLEKEQAVPDEENPTAPNGHGYVSICDCGYVFHRNQWQKTTAVETNLGTIRVSTVFLQLEHSGGMWYESAIFSDDVTLAWNVVDRYPDKDAAKEGHTELVRKLREGEFETRCTETVIELTGNATTDKGDS